MNVADLVQEVQCFNPGSGFQPVALQGSAERVKATIFVHRVFGDMCSITNFPNLLGGKLEVAVYEKRSESVGRDNTGQLDRHSLRNFLAPGR